MLDDCNLINLTVGEGNEFPVEIIVDGKYGNISGKLDWAMSYFLG